MSTTYKILILGASYGSLLGAKLTLAGHTVKLVCLPDEVELINAEGARVRMPARGMDGLVELNTQEMPGDLSAAGPGDVNPGDYDLIALAMQEPQYGAPEVSDLLSRIAASGKPCMSIMNMPPLAYLRRIPAIDAGGIRDSYTDPSVWDGFDPALITLCSPDPQAFRPPKPKHKCCAEPHGACPGREGRAGARWFTTSYPGMSTVLAGTRIRIDNWVRTFEDQSSQIERKTCHEPSSF